MVQSWDEVVAGQRLIHEFGQIFHARLFRPRCGWMLKMRILASGRKSPAALPPEARAFLSCELSFPRPAEERHRYSKTRSPRRTRRSIRGGFGHLSLGYPGVFWLKRRRFRGRLEPYGNATVLPQVVAVKSESPYIVSQAITGWMRGLRRAFAQALSHSRFRS
jgi:hypothetical protein